MKLTKTKLKQIIKEELRTVLNETWPEAEASREEAIIPDMQPGSMEVQPYPPNPVESRIQQLEELVYSLLRKLGGGPPIDPEDFPPIREAKGHAGKTCKQVHPGLSHEDWE